MNNYTEKKEYISRSQKKREAIQLQKLGEKLISLSESQLLRLNLPEILIDAVMEAHRLRSKEALRRQQQRIGSLMREIDPEPIQKFLEQVDHVNLTDKSAFHEIENWRDRMLEGDTDVMDEVAKRYPSMNYQYIRQLARNAQKEAQKKHSPKSSRTLFRYLKELANSADSI